MDKYPIVKQIRAEVAIAKSLLTFNFMSCLLGLLSDSFETRSTS